MGVEGEAWAVFLRDAEQKTRPHEEDGPVLSQVKGILRRGLPDGYAEQNWENDES